MVSAVKKRVLWLHTQPEHYHNRMMDALALGNGYLVPHMPRDPSDEFEWIAGFAYRGPGLYAESLPKNVESVFLRPVPGKETRPPKMSEKYHVNWREDLQGLGINAVIIAGYAQRTFRELIRECGERGIPVILWSDSNLRSDRGRSFKMRLKRAIKKCLLRRVALSVDGLLTANRLGIAFWRYYAGAAARSKVQVCAYYADYAAIDTARLSDRSQVLSRIGLNPDDKIVFTAARLLPVKGLDLMIRAFNAGPYASNGWKYVIAGTGDLESELKALAGNALGKSIFFAGFQQPADNLALMAHAHLMVLPSRFEPHGIVIGESLAAGTPVLASSVVGAAHGVVKEGKSGFIFRTENQADLDRKLAILNHPAQLASMRPAARDAFESWYRQTSPIVQVPRMVRSLLAETPP